MEYRFIKVIYEKLEDSNIEKYRDIAYEMIDYAKKKLGNKQFSKYYYNSVKEGLLSLDKKYHGIDEIADHDMELENEWIQKNPVSKNQCIFFTFFVMNCHIPLKNKERKQNKNEYVCFFNELYKSVKMGVLLNACMDDAILYFSLATKQPWGKWVDLQGEWNEKKKTSPMSKQIHEIWRSLSYSAFKDMVKEGLSENTSKTQSTYLETDCKINEIIDEYNEGIKTETSLSAIFSSDIQVVMENAERRRTWYLYRMITLGIDNQIDKILDCLNSWKISNGREQRKNFETAVNNCWLKTNTVEIYKRINDKTPEDARTELAEYLNKIRNDNITVEKITTIFNTYLGGETENVFVKPRYRFYHHFIIKEEEVSSKTYCNMEAAYFGSSKKAEKILNGEINFIKSDLSEKEKAILLSFFTPKRAARPLSKVFSGEVKTTREMLLLTALLVKRQGCDDIDRDYILNHVLKNCRFDIELDEDNMFDRFFINTFDNIEDLSENAFALEREYLKQCKGAIFYDIIRGKELAL